ncbi:MAG: hypothetical protein Q9179_004890 [Wetmoreana sp. 5 TL-2023]
MFRSTSGLGLGFISGGGTPDDDVGLITFNASDPSALTWTYQSRGTPHLELGAMQYARFGDKGVLVAFGGYIDLSVAELYDMSLIHVYDVDSKTWFNITATGDIPLARSEFCSVISASPDDSSFQITIYGGWNIHEQTAFEDVYVLAIPAFQWIKIDVPDNADTRLSGNAGRYQMSCALYGDRQLFSVGGLLILEEVNTIVNMQSCNTSWAVARMLDTTTFEWHRDFTPGSAAYAVPDRVSKIIGGGPSGGAKVTSPRGGFNDSTLASIFRKTVPKYAATSPTLTANNTDTTQSSVPESSTSVGAIAGGVVGGVVALAILGSLLYVFRFRQQRKGQSSEDSAQEWKKPELSTHASFHRKSNSGLHEMHEDALPYEIDGNNFLEAPSADLQAEPPIFELPSRR